MILDSWTQVKTVLLISISDETAKYDVLASENIMNIVTLIYYQFIIQQLIRVLNLFLSIFTHFMFEMLLFHWIFLNFKPLFLERSKNCLPIEF